MRSALDTLPDEQRRTIELAYFGGFSHSQIADMLDEPVGTDQGPDAARPREAAAPALRGLRGGGIRMTTRDHDELPAGDRRLPARRADRPRAPGFRAPPGRLRASAATRSSACGRRPTRCRARSSRWRPPPGLKASLMEVVEREAAEREPAPDPRGGRARARPVWRRLAPAVAAAARSGGGRRCCSASLAGFGVAQLGGDERRRTHHRRDGRRSRAAPGERQPAGRGRRRRRRDPARAGPARRSGRPRLPGVGAARRRDRSPAARSRSAHDGGGAVAVPGRPERRRGGAGHPRAAGRRARAERGAGPQRPAVALASASIVRPADGDLLPPSRPRDRRSLLELRPADLPGLHDHHAGGHALPRVRAAAHARLRTMRSARKSRRSPTS